MQKIGRNTPKYFDQKWWTNHNQNGGNWCTTWRWNYCRGSIERYVCCCSNTRRPWMREKFCIFTRDFSKFVFLLQFQIVCKSSSPQTTKSFILMLEMCLMFVIFARNVSLSFNNYKMLILFICTFTYCALKVFHRNGISMNIKGVCILVKSLIFVTSARNVSCICNFYQILAHSRLQ